MVALIGWRKSVLFREYLPVRLLFIASGWQCCVYLVFPSVYRFQYRSSPIPYTILAMSDHYLNFQFNMRTYTYRGVLPVQLSDLEEWFLVFLTLWM